MAKSYVYILRCADGTLYTGWTTDLAARLRVHNGEGKGGAKYTRSRRPVTFAYYEECTDSRSAMRREFAIKRLTREQKEALIASATFCAEVAGATVPWAVYEQDTKEGSISSESRTSGAVPKEKQT